jgi:ferredoxin
MTYVIAEPCIGTKDLSCVEVCPVDCIHPTQDEAGVDACFAEDQLPEEWQSYVEINAKYYGRQG